MAWIMISYLELLKKGDLNSGKFTQWKKDFKASVVNIHWLMLPGVAFPSITQEKCHKNKSKKWKDQ